MVSHPSVLYVDTDEQRGAAVGDYLERRKPPVTVHLATSFTEALALVPGGGFDCIVSCQSLDEGNGLELCQEVTTANPTLPFILSPVDGSEQLASEAMGAGVKDYVPREPEETSLPDLGRSIDTAIARAKIAQPGFKHHLLEDLLTHIPDTVYFKDQGGRFLEVSKSKAREVGESRVSIRGKSDFDHFEEDAAEEMYEDEMRVLETGEPVVDKLERVDPVDSDERKWVSVTKVPRRHEDGHSGTLGISRDVTDRVRYVEVVNELHEVTRELLLAETAAEVSETAVEAVEGTFEVEYAAHLQFGEGGATVSAATEAFDDLLDGPIGPETPRERLWFLARDTVEADEPRFVDDEETLFPDASESITTALLLPLESYGVLCLCRTSGQFEQYQEDTALILSSNVEAAFKRLDRLDRLERRERQTERLVQFSEEVAHDLRSPLTVAQGAVELARVEKDFEQLESAEQALGRIQSIIDGMLERAKAGVHVAERTAVDLSAVLTEAWENVDTRATTLDPPDSDAELEADRPQLVKSFENIIRNAVEHGGEDVTVDVGVEDDRIYIGDDGSGLPDGVGEEIFERGFSTADGGTGYGMAIVDDIVSGHGWEIRVDPDADGARFEITGVDSLSIEDC